MSEPGYVDALWVAGYEAEIPGGVILKPGETVVSIPEGEALASDNWKVVGAESATDVSAPTPWDTEAIADPEPEDAE